MVDHNEGKVIVVGKSMKERYSGRKYLNPKNTIVSYGQSISKINFKGTQVTPSTIMFKRCKEQFCNVAVVDEFRTSKTCCLCKCPLIKLSVQIDGSDIYECRDFLYCSNSKCQSEFETNKLYNQPVLLSGIIGSSQVSPMELCEVSEAPRSDAIQSIQSVQSSPSTVGNTGGVIIETQTPSEPSLNGFSSTPTIRSVREEILKVVNVAKSKRLVVVDRDINAAINIGICWFYDIQEVNRPGYLNAEEEQIQQKNLFVTSGGDYRLCS